MEVTAAIGIIVKLITVGMKAKDALASPGFDSKDIEVLRTLLDAGAAVLGSRRAPASDAAAQHLALVVRSFGLAYGRHWAFNEHYVPKAGWTAGVRRWFNKSERDRLKEIELRTKMAALSLKPLGDQEASKTEVRQVDALVGDPLDSPYYRSLWKAFSNPKLTDVEAEEEPPLDMGPHTRREFERHFLLAYWSGVSGAAGQAIKDYQTNLSAYRTRLIRELLVQDMSTWGDRHVFGNLERTEWEKVKTVPPIPFLPLAKMYVAPDGKPVHEGVEPEPILHQIEALLDRPGTRIVIVKADFGSGKSLTARKLAWEWADRYRDGNGVSADVRLPIFIRCADDISADEGFDLHDTVQRAWKRQGESFGLSLSIKDEALAMPEREQRTVFLFDGLDRVVLGGRRLDVLLGKLRDEATESHQFIIFSRPGVLPSPAKLEGIHILDLQPLRLPQINEWLDKWSTITGEKALTTDALRDRGLLQQADTPILLFMIAHTWRDHAGQKTPTDLAEIHEDFFEHIASGKHEADKESNKTVFEASEHLLRQLQRKELLPPRAKAPDAMLWLMSRVAWELNVLEQHQWLLEQRQEIPPEQNVSNIIKDELGIEGDAADSVRVGLLLAQNVSNIIKDELGIEGDAADSVRVGLLLAMQADPASGADQGLRGHNAEHMLFGHKSFREFLVARYWADRLHNLVRAKNKADWPKLERSLRGGRLLKAGDKSYQFLMMMVNRQNEHPPESVLCWNDQERLKLVVWAQCCFENMRISVGTGQEREEGCFVEDQHVLLREAALAIGSDTLGSTGLRANERLTLRSLLAWFWLTRRPAIIRAQGAKLQKADLAGADLKGADLGGADLGGADLGGADLEEANLQKCVLLKANLRGAILQGAILQDAILQDAILQDAILQRAKLQRAKLQGADLQGADLQGADLQEADLYSANLQGAILQGAILQGAILQGATYSRDKTHWPPGFDPIRAGAIIDRREVVILVAFLSRLRAEAIVRLLRARGVALSEEDQGQILSCTESEKLNLWMNLAAVAQSAEEVLRPLRRV